MNAIDTCLARQADYAARFARRRLATSPAMKLAVVACMDARLDTNGLLGLAEGDAHVIRNAGGLVTDDTLRSLTISQHLLGTREIMLIQHTDCGMQSMTDEAMKDAIQNQSGVRPEIAMLTFSSLEENVRQSLARLRASDLIPFKDAIRGFVFEVETGRLREVN